MSDVKPARRKLKTVGDLRAILSEAIEAVIDGTMEPSTAASVCKLAGQINASLLAEIEVARFSLSQTNAIAGLGTLSLESDAPKAPSTIEVEPVQKLHELRAELIKPSPKAFALADAAEAIQAAKSRPSALAPRIIDHRVNGICEIPGTPPAGRSALDQRHA